jgi:hypothetical protein
MDGNRVNQRRSWLAGGVAAAAFACVSVWLLAASPALAVPGHGSAELRLAQHDKGRTLSGQGVTVVAGSPAKQEGSFLSLPISSVEPGVAAATSDGWLRFKQGKRGVTLSGLRFDLTAGTLNGKMGGEEIPVFWLGSPAQVNAMAGSVSLGGGKLRLTAEAATALKQELGLERALRRDGVGMVWLLGQANPTRVSVPVASGQVDWGVLASWRKYVLGFQGPGSTGAITTADGATANGTLSQPSGYFGFPGAAGSTFERGLYGASDKLVLRTQGSVTFAKPGHCIIEVKLADLVVTLDGAGSSLALDSVYDIDKVEGMSCGPVPAVATDDVAFASLDLSGVAPTTSADGKTITWSAIPATLTAAGSAAFGLPQYQQGQALDPVTVTVGLG